MTILYTRKISDLGEDLILSPERYDPRRSLPGVSRRSIADVVDVTVENVTASTFSKDDRVLILDTTHAYDGFVVLRHDPVSPAQMGSAKRILKPGDVIISRLRPYLRQVAYIDGALFERNGARNVVVASTEFYVLRSADGFNAAALVPYLLSPKIQEVLAAGQEGGHHPRFSKELLSTLPCPDALFRRNAEVAKEVEGLVLKMRSALDNMQARIQSDI